jgi:hypothetical protein
MQMLDECIRTKRGEVARSLCARKIRGLNRLTDGELTYVLSRSRRELRGVIVQVVNLIFQKFIIIREPVGDKGFAGAFVQVRDITGGVESPPTTVHVDQIIVVSELFNRAAQEKLNLFTRERLPRRDALYRSALVKIASDYLRATGGSSYSAERTDFARQEAVRRIQLPIYRIGRGQAIIMKGDSISDVKLRALEIHNRAQFNDKFRRVLAIFIQQVILIALMIYFAWRFSVARLTDVSSNLNIFITVWIFAFVLILQQNIWNSNASYNEVTHFFGSWVPLGFFVILLSVMFGEILTLPIAIYMTFMIFIASKYDGNSLLISLVSAVTGSILGAHIKRRVHFIYAAILLASVNSVMLTASYLYSNRHILSPVPVGGLFSPNFLDAIRITFLSSMSSMMIIAILPVYESIFNVITRFKLVELADPAHPLLKELFQRAPSTWTHTLMVAALSEKASERLGLDTMLTRTGVYYHDIGKMKNAGFFVENQHLIPKPENVDRNNPQRAARVIIDHVLDGIEMAKAHRLPREVIAFIPEHHGTSTMAFFYHRALEKMKRTVKRESFRYPGPKPQRKETAIVMIADSVEAASRSLDEVTERSINSLIHRIINNKLEENQLDESGLTVGDLSVIQAAFRDVLMSSYHYRPKYPTTNDTHKLEARRTNNRSQKKGAWV